MTTWRLLPDDGERDPRLNLARDEALARRVAADTGAAAPVLRLWRSAPSVIVGRFQLAGAEVDDAAAARLGAPILRRFSGGGTVWHDPGNLNVTVVVRPDDPRFAQDPDARRLPGLYRLVLNPLVAAARTLGVRDATATERDVVTPRGKLSGIAAWLGGGAMLVHGTLLVDADLDALASVCAGPGAPGDPRWERTKSRRVGVTSLTLELAALGRPRPNDTDVDAAVIETFGAVGTVTAPSAWTPEDDAVAARLLVDRYANPDWHADRRA